MERLAEFVRTGSLDNIFYATGLPQEAIVSLCEGVESEVVAEAAEISNAPVLCAVLASRREGVLLTKTFYRTIDDGEKLTEFVRIMRSGVTGRKSFGELPRRLIANWFNARTGEEVFIQNKSRSFADIIKTLHLRPLDKQKKALYSWLLGLDYAFNDLPKIMQCFEDFKCGKTQEVPLVPSELFTKLTQPQWCQVIMRADWHWLSKNLAFLRRQGVFAISGMQDIVVNRLLDCGDILPYSILVLHQNAVSIPSSCKAALMELLETAVSSVPVPKGTGVICIDVGSSMSQSVGCHSRVRCIEVAALIVTAFLRKNPAIYTLLFSQKGWFDLINPQETVLTNAKRLARIIGGNTKSYLSLSLLSDGLLFVDWVIIISNKLKPDAAFMNELARFKYNNQHAKIVCLNIQESVQKQDIFTINGMSDLIWGRLV